MATKSPLTSQQERLLMTDLWDRRIAEDPYAFVMYAFPWGKVDTPLAYFKGPRSWQINELKAIRDHIAMNKQRIARGETPLVYRSVTASGRGIGKSALVAWLILWFQSSILGGTTVATANTKDQLSSRTWAELGKWHALAINTHWFERDTLSLRPTQWFKEALKDQLKIDSGYYYAQAQLWSEDNPDAFAGAHNYYGIMYIFDEASGIPAPIWKVTEGVFTEPILHRYQFAFSNPRRNTGPFYEAFHKDRDNWRRSNIDSRTVEGVDVAPLQLIIDRYGDDSDEARVEVKGEFPRQGDNQFISRSVIESAVNRELVIDEWAPLIMGVDVARYGDDMSVIRWRQGRDARSILPVKVKGYDNMALANLIADWANKTLPDAICIDAGNGTGVIDRLKQMNYKVHEVWFGSKSPDPEWANLRIYMWAEMRNWLNGGCIDNDKDLIDDLSGPEYKFTKGSDKMLLEAKEEMKKRGLASPDNGDALACTFSIKVARRDSKLHRSSRTRVRVVRDVDYDIFG